MPEHENEADHRDSLTRFEAFPHEDLLASIHHNQEPEDTDDDHLPS